MFTWMSIIKNIYTKPVILVYVCKNGIRVKQAMVITLFTDCGKQFMHNCCFYNYDPVGRKSGS